MADAASGKDGEGGGSWLLAPGQWLLKWKRFCELGLEQKQRWEPAWVWRRPGDRSTGMWRAGLWDSVLPAGWW